MRPLFFAVLLLSLKAEAASKNYDLYETKGSAARAPIFLFVHGGAWQSGDKSEYKAGAETLLKHGICSVIVNYRLSDEAKHPAPVEDLNAIITDLSKLKLKSCDTSRLYLAGHSAGAHMIAFWNTQYSSSAVKGFIGIEGIYDIPNLIKVWPGYADWFISKEFGSDPAKWVAASPTRLKMKSQAPWLVIHSAKDELVDLKQSKDFYQLLLKQNIKAQYFDLMSESHFGAVANIQKLDSPITKKIVEFLK